MKDHNSKGFDTLCIHGGHRPEQHRAHLTPIYATSTYTFDSTEQAEAVFQGKEEGNIYGRFGNPTIREAEEKIALLEAFNLKDDSGNSMQLYGMLHSSGMAAITTMLLANLKSGDKIITHHSLYGGTQEMIDKVLPGLGITTVVADFQEVNAVTKSIAADPAIKLMYLETPANPTLQCIDLKLMSAAGKAAGLMVCADNTFSTPYLQQPFAYDVDYVMHSTTKYLNGHGTAIGGILLGRKGDKNFGQVLKFHRLLGGNSNGFDAFVLTNGLRTLGLRMDRHCANAAAVAQWLYACDKVAQVNYTGLPSHPHHAIASMQMKQHCPMMSFELKGGYAAGVAFMNALKLCTNAVSLGTADTILTHPASTTHTGVPQNIRVASGISDGLIRMSVGLENVEDILHDFGQALGV